MAAITVTSYFTCNDGFKPRVRYYSDVQFVEHALPLRFRNTRKAAIEAGKKWLKVDGNKERISKAGVSQKPRRLS